METRSCRSTAVCWLLPKKAISSVLRFLLINDRLPDEEENSRRRKHRKQCLTSSIQQHLPAFPLTMSCLTAGLQTRHRSLRYSPEIWTVSQGSRKANGSSTTTTDKCFPSNRSMIRTRSVADVRDIFFPLIYVLEKIMLCQQRSFV